MDGPRHSPQHSIEDPISEAASVFLSWRGTYSTILSRPLALKDLAMGRRPRLQEGELERQSSSLRSNKVQRGMSLVLRALEGRAVESRRGVGADRTVLHAVSSSTCGLGRMVVGEDVSLFAEGA
jgi:hypothetical protein